MIDKKIIHKCTNLPKNEEILKISKHEIMPIHNIFSLFKLRYLEWVILASNLTNSS